GQERAGSSPVNLGFPWIFLKLLSEGVAYHHPPRPRKPPIMLQAIRSRAGSLIVKVLFAILIVAFGFWGIGSWLNDRSVDTTIPTVGSDKIRADQLASAVRSEIQTLRQSYGSNFDVEQAKQLGVVDEE